jgi:hypothetical protein
VSALASAILTFVAIVAYWFSQVADSDEDPEGLEVAAVFTWGTVVAALVGASVGLLVFAVAWWRSGDREPRSRV